MPAIPVADTISEIMERMSSLRGFGDKTIENIKHLADMKKKCSGPEKLDLTDSATQEWVGQVTDLFYMVDDLSAEAALVSKQSRITSLFSGCNLKPLLQLKQIEKRLVRKVAPTKNVIMLPNPNDAKQEEMLFDLPSWRLRQCFAYSVFILSSQKSVKPEKLVRLWMAEGFLGHSSSSSSREPEDLGDECIDEFLKRSIFSKGDEDGEICFHNLNKSVVEAYVVSKDKRYAEYKSIMENDVGRVMLSSKPDVSKGIPRRISETNKNVGTFLLEKESRPPNRVMLSWFACDEILSAFKRLRVLTLKDLGMKVLPASVGDLKKLRYLDLSRNIFKKLPICIGELKHLQTLLLSHCLKLTKLPDGVHHFPSLRHLEVDQCPNLMHMPSALKKLTWLRSLPHFVTSTRNGLGEFIHLNELRGHLEISHLERFKYKQQSGHVHAYLKKKQHLKCLKLRWNHDEKEKHSFQQDYQHLEPHPNLQQLFLIGYPGNQFPGWLISLDKLLVISLYECPECKYLPIKDSVLANLERLTLVSLASLQYITVSDKDNGCKELLQLKEVYIRDCPNLESWWKKPGTHNTTVFSAISKLVVVNCPKLVTMPLFPNLDGMLFLDSSNMEPFLNTLKYKSPGSDSSPPFSKLTYLKFVDIDEKQYPQQKNWLENFTSLITAGFFGWKSFESVKGWKNLSNLQNLSFYNCTDLEIPSEDWQGLKKVSFLVISDMPNLKSLPEGIKSLPSEMFLFIKNCPELTSITLPNNYKGLNVSIENCPKLASLPEGPRFHITNCPLLEALKQSRPELFKYTLYLSSHA